MNTIVYIISYNNHIAFVWFISYIFIDNKIDIREKKIFFFYFPISCFLYLRNHLILHIFWLYRQIRIWFNLHHTFGSVHKTVGFLCICKSHLCMWWIIFNQKLVLNLVRMFSLLVTGPLFDTATNMSNQPPGLSNCPYRKSKSISILWRCSVCK